MWPMIAEFDLRCTECGHDIQPGRLCLSELPEEIPSGVSRGDFKNYCIGCPECWKRGRHACYLRYLENNRSIRKTPRSLPCARCGIRIGAGESSCADVYYEWPEASDQSRNQTAVDRILQFSGSSMVTASQYSAKLDHRISLEDYRIELAASPKQYDPLIAKFHKAGLREPPQRTASEANELFDDTIPFPVRNLGRDAVEEFIHGKELSHIRSIRNHPELARDNRNLIWENSADNRSRGPDDMTRAEVSRIQEAESLHTTSIVFRHCWDAAKTTALYAGLLEAPVAAIENLIHYGKGRKTGEAALMDAGKSIATAAGSGAIVGFAITGAVALLGAAPLIITVAPILKTVGLPLYAFNCLKRILSALDNGLPVDLVGTYFCSPRCHDRYAYETGYSALMRWEEVRVNSGCLVR